MITKTLKKNVEKKCLKEGYVMPDSVEVIRRSIGESVCGQFNGIIGFIVFFEANVCNPLEGDIVEAEITSINNLGILAQIEPLFIVIPRQIHQDKKKFNSFKIGDKIKVEIIGKKYQLNSSIIEIFGKISDEKLIDMKEIRAQTTSDISISADEGIDETTEIELDDEEDDEEEEEDDAEDEQEVEDISDTEEDGDNDENKDEVVEDNITNADDEEDEEFDEFNYL